MFHFLFPQADEDDTFLAVQIGMQNYIGVLIAVVGVGGLMYMALWKELKAKKG